MASKQKTCNKCNRKLSILSLRECRCGGVFCAMHVLRQEHNCTFDIKSHWEKTNGLVKIEAKKLDKI